MKMGIKAAKNGKIEQKTCRNRKKMETKIVKMQNQQGKINEHIFLLINSLKN